jgi:hypothetical protein
MTAMPEYYEIVVKGHLSSRWVSWFDGMSVTNRGTGTQAETVVAGYVADQAALHGLLNKVRDLGLPLVAVTHVTMTGKRPGQ